MGPVDGSDAPSGQPGRLKRLRKDDGTSGTHTDGDEAAQRPSTGRKSKKSKKQQKAQAEVDFMAEDPTSPVLPKMAFEWFRESRSEREEELPALIQQWKALSDA